jgi:glyoxylase-like metal-dependent hydrolase (beta-lactamase superfamily II)
MHSPSEAGVFRDGYALLERFLDSADVSCVRLSSGACSHRSSRVRAGLRESLRRLLDLDFDNLLFAHGEPLIGGGRVALREFVADG